jgi:hypothetical protein
LVEGYGTANKQFLVTAFGSQINASSGIPDKEYIDILETGLNSRIFTGAISLSSDPLSNFGQLFVTNGPPSTTASFVYNDLSGGTRVALAKLQYRGSKISVSTSGQDFIRVGDNITVTVTDGDAHLNPKQVGAVQVKFISAYDYNEDLTLFEVAKDAGVFTGSIATGLGPKKINNRIDLQMPSSVASANIMLTVSLNYILIVRGVVQILIRGQPVPC